MKKLLIAASFMTIASSAFALTTGSIQLQGSVAQVISMTVTAQSIANTLDLTTTQNDLKVATVNESSNSKTGYTMTIASANLSKLKRTDGPETLSYTMKYNGSVISLASVGGTVITNSSASVVNVNKDVNISYTGASAATMVQGTYADTVTFTIAAI